MDRKEKQRLNSRSILIIVLALIVLAEGAFLLLHRKDASGSAGGTAAAAAEPDGKQDAGDQPSGDGSPAPDGGDKTAAEKKDADQPGASAAPDGDGTAQAPSQTPPPEIPKENKGKPYAGAIAAISNYMKAPSEATLAYLLGGELAGEQMQRFIPALFDMSGGTEEMLRSELIADLDLPADAATLKITDERALSQDQLRTAHEKLQEIQLSFSGMGGLADEIKGYSDAEWAEFGSQLGLSGADAKRLLTELTSSAGSIASLLSGASITEGYQVTLNSDSGATTVTNVYCIGGNWVTSAFFDMQFS